MPDLRDPVTLDMQYGLLPTSHNHAIMDASTHNIIVMPESHHHTHSGEKYQFSTLSEALGDDNSIDLVWAVGAKEAHLTVFVACGGDARIDVFESPTHSGNGALETLRCTNRIVGDGGNSSTLTSGATITVTGSRIDSVLVPGGTGGNATGGTGEREELVLNLSTEYLIRATNIAGGSKALSVQVIGYEHTRISTEEEDL